MALKTPVAIIIYNRPDLTKQVFDEVRRQKPAELFIIADGPKDDADKTNCDKVREIVSHCDWNVKVHKDYSSANQGMTLRTITGLDWVFDQVDQAIILEDDCLPHPTFFRYCEELLDYYRDDEHVMYVAGSNMGQSIPGPYSYAFTHWAMFWGWATWSRAWKKYNHNLDTWQKHTDKLMKFVSPSNQVLFNIIAGEVHAKRVTWDTSWSADCWLNNSSGITPVNNLVKNIGFETRSTNFSNPRSQFSMIPTEAIKFPLVHPKSKQGAASAVMEKAFFELMPSPFPA